MSAAAPAEAAPPGDTLSLDAGLSAAEARAAAGDRDGALILAWRTCSRFGERPEGWMRATKLVQGLNLNEQAEDLLEIGVIQCPGAFELWHQRARLAETRRDWPRAALLWEQLRERWPDRWEGYANGAVALSETGDFAAAERLLIEGQTRAPHAFWLYLIHARLGTRQRQWEAMLPRWALLRERWPTATDGYFGGALCLRELGRYEEAEAILREGIAAVPQNEGLAVDYARLAELREDWPAVDERWAAVRQRFPDCTDAFLRPIALARRFGTPEDVEARLREARDRFPDISSLAIDLAWSAANRRDADEALRRFAEVRARFPLEPAGYYGACTILRQQNLYDTAEEICEQGLSRIPGDPVLALEYAWCGASPPRVAAQGLGLGIERLESLRARFPAYAAGYVLGVRWLRESGRNEEAKALADAAVPQLPYEVELVREHVQLDHDAAERAKWIDWFRAFVEREPNAAAGYAGLVGMLMANARFDEAETILREIGGRFGPTPWIAAAYARCAEQRGDWAEAVRRWTEAEQAMPNEPTVTAGNFLARMRLADAEPGSAAFAEAKTAPTEAADAISVRDLMMQFDSLGADPGGCEFGLVQREFKAEPLGLLRWATISADNLTTALNEEFAGVGAPENTELGTARVGIRDEYWAADRRYGMMMHTFVHADEVAHEAMFGQICRRLGFLSRKLMDDLRAGEKIFVWRQAPINLSDEQLQRLHAAMRRYGDNTLLYVRFRDDDHADGDVERQGSGLLIGHVDRFILGRDGTASTPVTQTWVRLCRNAYRLWREDQSAGQPTGTPA